MRKYILFFSLLGCCLFHTQGQQMHKRVARALATFEAGEYYIAEELLKEAYDRVADEGEKTMMIFRIAECYRRTDQSKKAELWYSKAIKRGIKEPLAILYYADALKMNEKFEDALEQYKEYQKQVPDDIRAENGIKACEMAQGWLNNPTGYIVENAHFFNTKYNDFSPCFGRSDYNVVFFTSTREDAQGDATHGGTGQKFEDIYESRRDKEGKWSVPVPLDENINTEFSEGSPVMDPNFNTLYFTRCERSKNKKQGCQIYEATRDGDSWSKTKMLELGPDSMVFAHPAIASDGTLYFVSNMAGTTGGHDIWMTKKGAEGWTSPVNMGDKINTKGNEMFPFIHPDGTLYFSSNGHLGMGGMDIFKAELIGKGQWKVTNMGYPVNSSSDDFGITFESEVERGFFSSSREQKGDDIFTFYLPPIKFNVTGKITDEKTLKPIAGAEIKSISSDGFTMQTKSDENGNFKFMLKPSTDYIFIASAENYLKGKAKISTKGEDKSKDFATAINLASIKTAIELPNIFYDFNSANLRAESMASLNKLVETLNDNPNVTIELMSHSDSRGSEQYNLELSQKRAQSVVDFLITKGIDKNRLVAKGYGKTQPKVIDEKIKAQIPFFEIGTKLTDDYISKLPSEDYQEIAYQINRRTEFRVLSTDFTPSK